MECTDECEGVCVKCLPTQKCPCLQRKDIERFVAQPEFGRRLCRYRGARAALFDRVAEISLAQRSDLGKTGAVKTLVWSVHDKDMLRSPIDLRPLKERPNFECQPDLYSYRRDEVPERTLVVDFANRHVGGGCWGGGFVQEEQMVVQSTDFATRLYHNQDTLKANEAISYESVYMDAWWPREEAAKKDRLPLDAIEPCQSNPLTILAVDAPNLSGHQRYDKQALLMLCRKVFLIFQVALALDSPMILTGLLGGGAFRNNRPLVLLLHLLLDRKSESRQIRFHCPIFWSFCGADIACLEEAICTTADNYLARLREFKDVTTLGQVFELLLRSELPLSQNDADLQDAVSANSRSGS